MTGWWSERARNGGLDEVPAPGRAGRLWLCGKHYVGPDPEGVLAASGAHVIVCLNHRGELASRYPDYVEWLRANNGGRALWVPVHDMHVLGLDEFAELVGAIDGHLTDGRGVIVHCGAGIGRAGTVAAAVLMCGGMGREAALDHVRAHRAMAGPQTREQDEALVEYAASLL